MSRSNTVIVILDIESLKTLDQVAEVLQTMESKGELPLGLYDAFKVIQSEAAKSSRSSSDWSRLYHPLDPAVFGTPGALG